MQRIGIYSKGMNELLLLYLSMKICFENIHKTGILKDCVGKENIELNPLYLCQWS